MTEEAGFKHIILNGELHSRESAQISVYNQALFSSFGVYESIEVDSGVLFHLDDHLERLYNSARIIELPIRYPVATVKDWVEQLVQKDVLRESLLRVLVFGPNTHEDVLIYILPTPLPHYPSTYYTGGARGITFPGSRPLPQAKTLNTLVNYLALRQARKAGAHEAFLVNEQGLLTEGSRSNLFAVAEGRLMTPPAEGVLSGITRDLVIRLARKEGLPVSEEPLPSSRMAGFEELFVTSTSMHVIPIIEVDGKPLGDGRIGPLTQTCMHLFERYYARVVGREIVPMPL